VPPLGLLQRCIHVVLKTKSRSDCPTHSVRSRAQHGHSGERACGPVAVTFLRHRRKIARPWQCEDLRMATDSGGGLSLYISFASLAVSLVSPYIAYLSYRRIGRER
jgi:hypothetical protein